MTTTHHVFDKIQWNIAIGIFTAITCIFSQSLAEESHNDLFSYSLEDLLEVEFIEVSAQRYIQPLQEVPISVTALSQERLNSFAAISSRDLQQLVPGLTFTQSLSSSAMFIRGVGSSYSPAGGESPIALYVDDVYRSSTASAFFDLTNIESIEVLKGPQGTLFGRNASGGVINVRTTSYSSAQDHSLTLESGNYGQLSISGYAGTEFDTDSSANLFFKHSKHDGFGENLVTGSNTFYDKQSVVNAKLSTSWDNTNLDILFDWSEQTDMAGVALLYLPESINRFTDSALYAGDYNTTGDTENRNTNQQIGASIVITSDMEWGTFKSISGFRHTGIELVQDGDRTPLARTIREIKNSDDTFTQEFQLLSKPNTTISWVLGGYFLDQKVEYHFPDTQLTTNVIRNSETLATTESFALYGQGTFMVFNNTNLSLGLRYTNDSKSVDDRQVITNNNNQKSMRGNAQGSWSELTWRIAIDHHFSKKTMGYISYNRGFKGGTFNIVPFAPDAIDPEILDSFEIGFKYLSEDQAVRVNSSAYYYSYDDLQVQGNATEGDSVFNVLFNAAKATIKGLEVDAEYALSQSIRLRAGLALIDGQYDEIIGVPFAVPEENGEGNKITTPTLTDVALLRTPDFSANFSTVYNYSNDIGLFTFTLSASYNSEYFFDAAHITKQSPTTMMNASLLWSSHESPWAIQLWGRNLLNELRYTNANAIRFGNVFSPGEPRMFGVKASYRF